MTLMASKWSEMRKDASSFMTRLYLGRLNPCSNTWVLMNFHLKCQRRSESTDVTTDRSTTIESQESRNSHRKVARVREKSQESQESCKKSPRSHSFQRNHKEVSFSSNAFARNPVLFSKPHGGEPLRWRSGDELVGCKVCITCSHRSPSAQ